jgi:hypothetical protein
MLGTLIRLARDEDTGEIELCGDEECGNRPLWQIRFDDGRVKKYCCEGSIVEVRERTRSHRQVMHHPHAGCQPLLLCLVNWSSIHA